MSSPPITCKQLIVSIVAIAFVASVTVFPAMGAGATDARLPAGTSNESLVTVSVTDGDSRMVLIRFTLEPGATIRLHSHSGPAVFTVISGALTTELVRGGATIDRDGVEESAEIGATIDLSDGETIAFAPNAGKTIENHSTAPLLLVASLLLKTNEPIFAYDSWPPPHTSAR